MRTVTGRCVVVLAITEPGIDREGRSTGGAPGDLPGAGSQGRGDRHHRPHPFGVHHRPLQSLHPAHRTTHHRKPPGDTQVVGDRSLAAHHVAHRDRREGRGIGPPRAGVHRRRPRRPLTTAEDVDAHHEVAVGVEPATRPDDPVPPTRDAVRLTHATVGVRVAGQGMADEDGVVRRRRELTPGLVRHRDLGEDAAALEGEGATVPDGVEQAIAHRVARLPGTGDGQIRRIPARVQEGGKGQVQVTPGTRRCPVAAHRPSIPS